MAGLRMGFGTSVLEWTGVVCACLVIGVWCLGCSGCDNSSDRFTWSRRPARGSLAIKDIAGKYVSFFPTGKSTLELDPGNGRYRAVIYWRSGRTFSTDWRDLLTFLNGERPSVLFARLADELVLQRESDKFPTVPLSGELTQEECEAYLKASVGATFGLNPRNELILHVGANPDVYFVKESDGNQESGKTSGEKSPPNFGS